MRAARIPAFQQFPASSSSTSTSDDEGGPNLPRRGDFCVRLKSDQTFHRSKDSRLHSFFLQKNMQSSNNTTESTNELVESEQHILNFLDSMDTYLTLMDSLSSSLRQGWLDLASARQSMGALRVSSVLFDLKSHHASTTLQVHNGDHNMESPHFTLSKWASSDDPEKHSEEAKFEEDELLQNKSTESPREQNHDTPQSPQPLERRASGGSPVTPDNQAQRERSKSLSMFGTLVSPKLRATQLSFETALEMLIEIANMRASLLCTYKQVLHDQKTAK